MNISWRTIFSPALIAGFFTPMDKTCDFVVNEEGGGGGRRRNERREGGGVGKYGILELIKGAEAW